MFFILVEFITFIAITLFHIVKLPFSSFNTVLASYIEVLVKNHLYSLKGTLDILSLWVNSFTTKKLPLNETMMYFWEFKITWVGMGMIIVLILYKYFENKQEHYY